jgi:hypothetical protein
VKLDYPEADSPLWFSIFQGVSDSIEREFSWSGPDICSGEFFLSLICKITAFLSWNMPSLCRFSDWEHEYSGKKQLTTPLEGLISVFMPEVLERGKREFWELGVMRKAAFFSDSVVFV